MPPPPNDPQTIRLRPLIPAGFLLTLAYFPIPFLNDLDPGRVLPQAVAAIATLLASALCFASTLPDSLRRAGRLGACGAWLQLAGGLVLCLPIPSSWWPVSAALITIGTLCAIAVPLAFARASRELNAPHLPLKWRTAAIGAVLISVLGLVLLIVTRLRGNEISRIASPNAAVSALACVAFIIPSLLILLATRATQRFVSSAGAPHCSACAYPLTGLPTARCPECGYISQHTQLPPLRFALGGVPWNRAVMHIVLVIAAATIFILQRPESSMLGKLPVRWLLLYADRLLPEGSLSFDDGFIPRRNSINFGPIRSYAPEAKLVHRELLGRVQRSALSPEDLAVTISHAVSSVCDSPARSNDLEQLLQLARAKHLLTQAHTRRLFDSWLTYAILARSTCAAGEPLGIECVIHERFPATLLDPRLNFVTISDVCATDVVSLTLGGETVVQHVPLKMRLGSSEFTALVPDRDTPLIVPNTSLGSRSLVATLSIRWMDERLSDLFTLPVSELNAAGIPSSWTGTTTTQLQMVAPAERTLPTAAIPDADKGINERVQFHILQRQDIMTFERSGTVRTFPTVFVFQVFVPAHRAEGPIGTVAFTRNLTNAGPYIHTKSPWLSELCQVPAAERRLILHPYPAGILDTPMDGPVYDGPDIEVPVRCGSSDHDP